jgi:hypothetical protein
MKTLQKQNETLKALNGIGIEVFQKTQFDFNFQLDLDGQFPPHSNNWILNIQFQVQLVPKT